MLFNETPCRVLYSSASLSAPPCPRVLSVTARSLAPSPVASIPSPPAINHCVRHGQTSHPHHPHLAVASSSSSSSVQSPRIVLLGLLEVCCFCAHSSTCCNNSLRRLGRRTGRREQDKPWHCADRAGSEEGGVLTVSPSYSIDRVPLPLPPHRPPPAPITGAIVTRNRPRCGSCLDQDGYLAPTCK